MSGNINLLALGGGQDSNITIRDSDLSAGQEATLVADNRIDILAAEPDWAQHSTNKASAASIGVSFGTSGFLVNASASASKGRSDGTETSYSRAGATPASGVA